MFEIKVGLKVRLLKATWQKNALTFAHCILRTMLRQNSIVQAEMKKYIRKLKMV